MNAQYAMYLRKSRADIESERNGEDTLARHKKLLLDTAKRQHINIVDIYREVVSGDSIAARPEMQKLLSAVEQGLYAGVLVVEIERLARGDTVDQGIVAQTFKFSDTKIITPIKIYDPANEFDEEYFEFGLFMSRREYKTINRRLQLGRIASVNEGKFVGSRAPYGYEKIKLPSTKGYTLAPKSGESNIIRMIYELYVNGEALDDGSRRRLGTALICRRLNDLHVPTKSGNAWSNATVRDMLRNPVYDGKIRWNWRPNNKRMIDGTITNKRKRQPKEEWILVDGLHEPLVSHDIWSKAQELIDSNPPRPIGERDEVRNPLAGLIVCGVCGHRMIRRPKGKKSIADVIICQYNTCTNVGVYLEELEEAIIEHLKKWVNAYKIDYNTSSFDEDNNYIEIKEAALIALENQKENNIKQLDNIYSFFEQGIYTREQFLERSRAVAAKATQLAEDMTALNAEICNAKARQASRQEIIPKVESLIECYSELETAQAKNDMLKEVIESVTYMKSERGTKKIHTEFNVTICPKIPRFN